MVIAVLNSYIHSVQWRSQTWVDGGPQSTDEEVSLNLLLALESWTQDPAPSFYYDIIHIILLI